MTSEFSTQPGPLSPLQQGMLFHHLYAAQSGVDVVHVVVHLREQLDLDCFQKAWQAIIDRFDSLRTSIHWKNLQPLQQVHSQVPVPLEREDLSGLPGEQQRTRYETYLRDDRKRGFDLEQPPLMRLRLFRLGDAEYKLVWTIHHIIGDGRSYVLALQDLFTFYEAFSRGDRPTLPSVAPYRKYVAWLIQQDLGGAHEFWKEKLKGIAAPTPLLGDRGTTSTSRTPADYLLEKTVLASEVTSALKGILQREDLTLNTLVQGAWALLLSRYSGEENVILGASKTTRRGTIPEAESMFGLFLSTLPVRVQVKPGSQFLPWLRELRNEWISYRQFEHTPLVQIKEASEFPSAAPLFDSLIAYEHEPFGETLQRMGGGWARRGCRLLFGPTGSALTLYATGGERLQFRLGYDCQRFAPATIAAVLGHLKTLLEAVARDPHQRLRDLPLLTEGERRQILVQWNATAKPYPATCVHSMFEAQARRTPGEIAAVYGEDRLSYSALNARANQLARYLQRRGVGRGSLVGICMERSLDMVVAALATLKLGAAYVPLDPHYPRERISFMLEDSKAVVLLTQQSLSSHLPAGISTILCLDSGQQEILKESPENFQSGATPEDLVYVIYTSGSTGKPKGVCLPHRALTNLLFWQLEHSCVGRAARTLQFTSLSFDVSFQEIFSTWSSGGTLVLVSEEMRRDAAGLLHFLREQQIARLFLPFVALQQLAEAAEEEKDLPALHEVITAGEQLQITKQIANLFRRLPACRLYNHYGPSESHVVTSFQLTGSPDTWPSLPPIGKPIANTQIYILDPHLQPVPAGVGGELYIGGTSLADGYLGRHELTAERFVPDPFNPDSAAQLYKTGDLARFRPDGEIEYLGRIDNQVKIRGHRIELGEIESVLRANPLVRDAVLTATEDRPGNKRLVAYVVAATATEQKGKFSGELRQYLKEQLPEYMVPSGFVLLEKLPLTPSGKVDRRALPKPEEAPHEDETYLAPRTATEQVVAGIWADVLRVTRVGTNDHFFDMGHSLLATQVISRVRKTLEVDLPLRTLFDFPTVAGFAQQIDAAHKGSPALQAPPIVPVPRGGPLPLSFAQQRLWFVNQLEPGNNVYNLPLAFRFAGPLQVEALRRGLEEIVRRHEVLRTTFHLQDEEPVQVIAPDLRLEMPAVDTSSLPEALCETEARRLAQQEATNPFDLARGPLIRAILIKVAQEEHILLITMHHIASDGWSGGVLMEELGALYDAFSQGRRSPLEDLPVQYADYAVWQRKWIQAEVLDHHLGYWKNQLRGVPQVLELPFDRPRPDVRSFQGAMVSTDISPSLARELKALSQREEVTLFMTLVTGFQTLLSRYSGQEQLIVGTDLANRTSVETERLIGFFINVLPLRADQSGDPSFRELLRRVREAALGAYAHQEMPFDKLVEELSPERSLSHNPLVQVLFVMLNAPSPGVELAGLRVTPFELELTKSKFDLALFVQERDGGLAANWLYTTDLFDGLTIQKMAGNYVTLLNSIAAQPEMRISALEILTESERVQEELGRKQHQQIKIKQLKTARRKAVGVPEESTIPAVSKD